MQLLLHMVTYIQCVLKEEKLCMKPTQIVHGLCALLYIRAQVLYLQRGLEVRNKTI